MHRSPARSLVCVAWVVTCIAIVGCVNSITGTIPAQRLSAELLGPSRDDLVSIDFTRLGQVPPRAHVIGADDILGVYVQGFLGNGQEVEIETQFPPDAEKPKPAAWYEQSESSKNDSILAPAVGSPITVMDNGTITLPYAPDIIVAGLTVAEATATIREVYTTKLQLLQPGQDVIKVAVIKPRSIQVLVLRSDSINKWPNFKLNNATLATKRGSGKAVDLPVYQNDVLHALTESGGLPGSDAGDEIWVLRCAPRSDGQVVAAIRDSDPTNDAIMGPDDVQSRVIKIPLKVPSGQPLSFAPTDVILQAGDVVFMPPRDREHFFVGGVLKGQQVYLPRDYELDVVGAIAMVSGQVAGPPGGPLFQGQHPGSVLSPTRVLILRKVAGGEQVTIHVDLKKAIQDRNERIAIQPGDVILLQFTPGQNAQNLLANMFGFKFGVTRGFLSGRNNAGTKFSSTP